MYCFRFSFFFFKQKTAYEMRISDWSSDVCSSDLFTFNTKRRDERGQHDQPRIGHQLGDFAYATNVLDSVGVGKAQILAEPVAHVVAVEQEAVLAERVQPLLDQIGDRRLARPRQTGEPQQMRTKAFLRGVSL